jgi:serine/threonine-protein kinase RsbT
VAALTETDGLHLSIGGQMDVEEARRAARLLARGLHFNLEEAEVVALVVSELASNLVRHATRGEIKVVPLDGPRGTGIEVTSHDRGPGIADIKAALSDGFSTAGGLGSGLGSVRRLMDEFEVSSGVAGTNVVCRTWRRTP